MFKKVILLLSTIIVMSFTSCGGGSSKEAKELLSKILQFVGIPHSIIANVCQDSNHDGICGSGELFTKVTINKGDSMDDIIQKISLTSDGQYFLETIDATLPILVELQDVANIHYDDGKFTLAFNGFEHNRDDNETKEISILESMVDADAISKAEADKFRTLNNVEAQEKYYAILLEDLEININTLRAEGLDSKTAVKATIKEMADETKVNKDKADKINACGIDQICVDKNLDKLSKELLITDTEAQEIKQKEETNNNTSTDNNSNQNKIDMAKHMPTSSMTKNFISYSKTDGQEEHISNSLEDYVVDANIVSSTDENGVTLSTTTINEDTLVSTGSDGKLFTSQRYVEIGDVILNQPLNNSFENEELEMKSVTTGSYVCKLDTKIDNFTQKGYGYVGNILKVDCIFNFENKTTTKDTTVISKSYSNHTQYLKEEVGLVAFIDDTCNESDLTPKICTHSEKYYQK